MVSTELSTRFSPRNTRSTPATEMVASPTRTTPLLSSRLVSSTRLSSRSGRDPARLGGCVNIHLFWTQPGKTIRRPRPRQRDTVAAGFPAPYESLHLVPERLLPGTLG